MAALSLALPQSPGPTPSLLSLCRPFASSTQRTCGQNPSGRQEFKLSTLTSSLCPLSIKSVSSYEFTSQSFWETVFINSCSYAWEIPKSIRNLNSYHMLIAYLFICRLPPPTPSPGGSEPGILFTKYLSSHGRVNVILPGMVQRLLQFLKA